MKKLLKFVLIVLILGLAAYGGYRFYLPSLIAESLTSDQPSALIPSGMREKVTNLKTKVDREIKKVPVFLKEHKIGYEDLQNIIDRVSPGDLLDAYYEIATTRITSTNQVFDIGVKHVKINGYDLEIFRSAFVQHVTVEDINKAIRKIEENDLLASMSIPVAKETVKKVLESSRQEIQQELQRLNQTDG
jgi:hypothetical protein